MVEYILKEEFLVSLNQVSMFLNAINNLLV